MTYDAEGVINIRREDGRERSGEKKEEPRTRGSRSEEIAIGASEEEKETAVTGEPTTERETAITRGPEEEKDTVEVGESVAARGSTAIRVPRTEEETQKSGRLEGRRNHWATPGPDEEKSGDHPRAGRAPGGTWPSQATEVVAVEVTTAGGLTAWVAGAPDAEVTGCAMDTASVVNWSTPVGVEEKTLAPCSPH
ncbi:hypothetical protein NDU88_003486 [Pleurodeles waltl]|uniref:Uncharacterized protein n=2 Tax=Pleurodeles waltl TaxID=8319 RepID=A0AAV7VDG1_PLEWA|nr:hypothetical protein NDU88_003486 [Pleurodeles waltl]